MAKPNETPVLPAASTDFTPVGSYDYREVWRDTGAPTACERLALEVIYGLMSAKLLERRHIWGNDGVAFSNLTREIAESLLNGFKTMDRTELRKLANWVEKP